MHDHDLNFLHIQISSQSRPLTLFNGNFERLRVVFSKPAASRQDSLTVCVHALEFFDTNGLNALIKVKGWSSELRAYYHRCNRLTPGYSCFADHAQTATPMLCCVRALARLPCIVLSVSSHLLRFTSDVLCMQGSRPSQSVPSSLGG